MGIVISVYKNFINGWGNAIKYLKSLPRLQQPHRLNN